MALVFLVLFVAFLLVLLGRRKPALVVGLIGLLFAALMFRYHLTDQIRLSL